MQLSVAGSPRRTILCARDLPQDGVTHEPRPDLLKRLATCLLGRDQLVFMYAWQRASALKCDSDTDQIGCPKTRKPTSGGCLLLGGHLLNSWGGSADLSISLSLGSAGYYGVVNAAGSSLGQEANIAQACRNPRNRSPSHDPDVSPLDYSMKGLGESFFKAVALEDADWSAVGRCICGWPDCRECFPPLSFRFRRF